MTVVPVAVADKVAVVPWAAASDTASSSYHCHTTESLGCRAAMCTDAILNNTTTAQLALADVRPLRVPDH